MAIVGRGRGGQTGPGHTIERTAKLISRWNDEGGEIELTGESAERGKRIRG